MENDDYKGPVYFGLGDFDIEDRTVDLGRGVRIVPAKAVIHLPISFQNLNKESMRTPSGVVGEDGRPPLPKPALWHVHNRAVTVGAEIVIEYGHFKGHDDDVRAAWFIMSLIRLWANAKTSLVGISFDSFSDIAQAKVEMPVVYPLEVGIRHIHLVVRNEDNLDKSAEWIKKHCWDAYDLYQKNDQFRLMFDALSDAHYIQNEGLILVSLIAALEGMFSDAQSEVALRVSSYVACFMAEPGPDRREVQKIVNNLYAMRSKAAHGKPKHEYKDVVRAFMVLRRVMLKVIEQKRVPTSEELKIALYGG